MSAREAALEERVFSTTRSKTSSPSSAPGGSDSACARQRGRLPLGERPLAAARDDDARARSLGRTTPRCPTTRRAFYEYHGCLVEPWDGPAALCFTDGDVIGATLDRNGLRPAKYVVTTDGLVVLASEFGVLDIDPADASSKRAACSRARCSSSTPSQGRIVSDEEIKQQVATQKPYAAWVAENKIDLSALDDVPSLYTIPPRRAGHAPAGVRLHRRRPARSSSGRWPWPAKSPWARWASTSRSRCSPTQAAAPVPLLQAAFRAGHQPADRSDPRRDRDVARQLRGRRGQPARGDAAAVPHARAAAPVPHATTTSRSCARTLLPRFPSRRPSRCTSRSTGDPERRRSTTALDELCRAASRAIAEGRSILILSDRDIDASTRPFPSLLATAAVHHHLIREGTRVRAGIVVEIGRAARGRTTSRCSSATARAPSIRTSRSRPSPRCCRDKMLARRSRPRPGEREVHQGRSKRASSRSCPRWGSARCPATRARRSSRRSASTRSSSTSTSPAPRRASRGVGLREIAEEALHAPRARPSARVRRARARRRRPLPLPRDRRAPPVEPRDGRRAPEGGARRRRKSYEEYAALINDADRAAASRCAACGTSSRRARRCRSTRSSRRRRSSSASPPAR